MEFRRGSTKVHWRTDHGEGIMQSGEFLKKDLIRDALAAQLVFPCRTAPSGIAAEKKKDIVDKLCPLMKESARALWKELLVSANGDTDLVMEIPEPVKGKIIT